MRFEEWEPIYHDILREFGYSEDKDRQAARLLASLAKGRKVCLERCLARAIGQEVTVCGHGDNLGHDLDSASLKGTVICADGATGVLMDRGLRPDLIVTDLDGDWRRQQEANAMGTVAVIHAHGDNMPVLRQAFSGFKGEVALTTQSVVIDRVRNYGGFTDGDRAVELSRSFGARQVHLLGFDFNTPRRVPSKDYELKRRKLEWARRIIFQNNPSGVRLILP